MKHFLKIAFATALFAGALGGTYEANARHRSFPLTSCGPDLAYLCPIRGYFDDPPYQYSLAIHPACIKYVRVETPRGVERRRIIVCGAEPRMMSDLAW
jgi:hypothetical protein